METPEAPKPTAAEFSRETLQFFDFLLGQVTLAVGSDDFEDQATRIGQAKRELRAALAKED